MALVQVGQGGIMLVKRGIPLPVPQAAVLMRTKELHPPAPSSKQCDK